MNRLTSDKDAQDMNMVELAYNSCYAKDGRARYRDYDTDIDARQFAMELLERYADIPNEFTCDDDFDEAIIDYMSYGIENPEGLIALFYRNLWAMADLRGRLKRYEDTNLTPDQMLQMDKMYQDLSKEVMKYRKIGTVAEVKSMGKYSRLAKKHGTTGQAIDECAEYEAIGTVEECREAVEKQRAKKPVKDEYSHECCPSCGWIVCKDEYDGRYLPHCENCGQAIDWSDME